MFTSFKKKRERERTEEIRFPIGRHLFAWQVHAKREREKKEKRRKYTLDILYERIYIYIKENRRRVRTYSSF